MVLHVDIQTVKERRLLYKAEETIVAQLTDYCRGRCCEPRLKATLDSVLSELRPGLVAARHVNSVLLYVYRETLDDIDTLIRLVQSGRLQQIIRQVFQTLSPTLNAHTVTVSIHDQQQFTHSYQLLQYQGFFVILDAIDFNVFLVKPSKSGLTSLEIAFM